MMAKLAVSFPLRVLVADDHEVVRRGLCELLEADGQIVVVAEACDGEEAVALTDALRPSVAILEARLPTISGIEAARRIKAMGMGAAILILAAWDDAACGSALLDAGADRYILKSADEEAMIRAVKEIAITSIQDRGGTLRQHHRREGPCYAHDSRSG